MAAAQSELSMDEILASIRRIIHEEEEPQAKAPRDDTNTVDLRRQAENSSKTTGEAEARAAAPEPAEDKQPQRREVQVTTPALSATAAVSSHEDDADERFDRAPFSSLAVESASARPAKETVAPSEAPSDLSPSPSKAAVEKAAAALDVAPSALPTETEPKAPPKAERSAEEALTDRVVSTLLSSQKADGVAAAFAQLKRNIGVASAAPRTLEDMVEDMLRPMLQAWLDEHLQDLVEKKIEEEIQRLSGR